MIDTTIKEMTASLVEKEIVGIRKAMSLTDTETVFLYECVTPTVETRIPDYSYFSKETTYRNAEDLLLAYQKKEVSFKTHYVNIAYSRYGYYTFVSAERKHLFEKKKRIEDFKEKYEKELKLYLAYLDLENLADFFYDVKMCESRIDNLIFKDRSFTLLAIYRFLLNNTHAAYFYDMYWDDDNLELTLTNLDEPSA